MEFCIWNHGKPNLLLTSFCSRYSNFWFNRFPLLPSSLSGEFSFAMCFFFNYWIWCVPLSFIFAGLSNWTWLELLFFDSSFFPVSINSEVKARRSQSPFFIFFCCCEFVPDVQIIINRNRNQTQVLVQRSFALEWFVFTEKMNELLILSSVTFFFRKCFIECGVVWFGESSVRPARDPH